MKNMKLLRSFKYAFSGMYHCLFYELNFKIHVIAAVIVTVCGILLKISGLEWIAILICIAIVMSLEMMNTAIERLCDIIQPEIHPKIKVIKDVSAGAVLAAAFGSAMIGLFIFIPKIIFLLKEII